MSATKTRKRKKPVNVRMSDGALVADTTPKARRPGGAWRAWVREQLLNSKIGKAFRGMTAIAEAYRNLPPEKKAELKGIGKAATVAGRLMENRAQSSFGRRGREIERYRIQQYKRSVVNSLTNADENLADAQVLEGMENGTGSVVLAVSSARQLARIHGTVRWQRMKEDIDKLHAFLPITTGTRQ